MNKYLQFCRKAAAEGMVLLKNEQHALPLKQSDRIALFGKGQFVTVKSGSGSGDVVGVRTINVREGLEGAGVTLCKELLEYNQESYEKAFHNMEHRIQHAIAIKNMDKIHNEVVRHMDEIPMTEEIASRAFKQSDVAVVILSRVVGEGVDVKLQKGDFYLTDAESEMLRVVRKCFQKMVVCLNYGGVYDLNGVLAHCPDAILYMSQGGQEIGNALADVLLGKVTPSGKLSDTWAKGYQDYPSTEHFGEMEVPYQEGIYVGYRYFDTFNITPLYEFGYGLSYTDFEIQYQSSQLQGSVLKVRMKVQNIGSMDGREVVQCYLSKPNGTMEQPYQELVAFAKTKDLKSGEAEILELVFDFKNCAAYSEQEATFVLPSGDYFVRIGNSSRNTHIVAKVTVESEIPVMKTVNRFARNLDFEEISRDNIQPYSYAGEEEEKQSAESFVLAPDCIACQVVAPAEACPPQLLEIQQENADRTITIKDVVAGNATAEDLVAQFSLDELGCIINGVNYGQDMYEGGIIGSMADAVLGAAGETFTLPKYQISGNVCADGPAGIRLLSYHDDFTKIAEDDERKTLTAYPIGTCFANSWDIELSREYGACICEEMRRFSIEGWLAPGMNIHRNPLCGRNFEYFSEDPLLSGKMAAAQTMGVQVKDGVSTGCYTTIKHFLANEQENLRTEMSSEVSERTLREIYLKAFEIAVKESQPHALMTSYNRINGIHATVNYDLLNGVLRSEWGFEGLVMSDWGAQGELALRPVAGNDLNMPGSGKKYIELLKNKEIDIASVQACAVRVIQLLLKTTEHPILSD